MPFDTSTLIGSREMEDYQNSIYLRERGERNEAIARHSEHLRRTGRTAKDEFLSKIWSDGQTEPGGASAAYQRIVSMLEKMDDYMDETVTFENLEAIQQGMLQNYSMMLYFCDEYLKKRSGRRFTAQGRKRQQLVQDLRQKIEDEALMLQNGLDEIPIEGEGKTLRSMLTGAQPLNPIIARARDFSLPSSYQEEEEEAESAGTGAEAGAVESAAAESADSAAADSAHSPEQAPEGSMQRLANGVEPEHAGEANPSDARPAAGPVEGTLAHLRMRRRELRQDASLDKDQSATIQILLEQIDRSVVRGEQALAANLLDRVTELCGDAPEDSTLGLLAQSCRAFKQENGLQGSGEDEAYESSMTLSSRAFEGDEAAQNAFPEYLHLPADTVRQMMVRAAEASDAGQMPSGREQTLIGQGQINETNRMLRMQQRRLQGAGASPAAPFQFSDAMYRQAMQTADQWERMADAARLPGKARLHRMLNVSYLSNTLGIPTEGGEELPRGAVRRINMQAGKIVMESGFMRTSFAADKTRADLPILLTLLCDEGTPVLPTGNMAQGEMLLGRGTSYMILGAVRHGAENALQLPTTHGRFANQQTEGKEGSGAFQGIEIIAKVAGPMSARPQPEEQLAEGAQPEEEQPVADVQQEEALPERPDRPAPRPVELVAAGAPPAALLERQRQRPLPPTPAQEEELPERPDRPAPHPAEQVAAGAPPAALLEHQRQRPLPPTPAQEEVLPERPDRPAPRPVELVAAGAPPAVLLERQRQRPLPPTPVQEEEELPERPDRPAPRPVELVAAGAPPAALLERQRQRPLPPTPAQEEEALPERPTRPAPRPVEQERAAEAAAPIPQPEVESRAAAPRVRTRKKLTAEQRRQLAIRRVAFAGLLTKRDAYDQQIGSAKTYESSMQTIANLLNRGIGREDRAVLREASMSREDIPADQAEILRDAFQKITLPMAMDTYRTVQGEFLADLVMNCDQLTLEEQSDIIQEDGMPDAHWLAQEENRQKLIGTAIQRPDSMRTLLSRRHAAAEAVQADQQSAEPQSGLSRLFGKIRGGKKRAGRPEDERTKRHMMIVHLPAGAHALWTGAEGGYALHIAPDSVYVLEEIRVNAAGAYELVMRCRR